MKKRWYEEEGAKEYTKAYKRVQKALRKAIEDWIDTKCKVIDACLNKNNSKKAYQLVKDLTLEKDVDPQLFRTSLESVLQKKNKFSAEYCSELYNYESYGDSTGLQLTFRRRSSTNPS